MACKFSSENPQERNFEETIDLHGLMILKSFLNEEYARCGMSSFTLGES